MEGPRHWEEGRRGQRGSINGTLSMEEGGAAVEQPHPRRRNELQLSRDDHQTPQLRKRRSRLGLQYTKLGP